MIQLPVEFSEYMCRLLGQSEYDSLAEALQSEPPVSIRLNPFKWRESLLPSVSAPVPWAEGAFYLPVRPAFTFDPLLHAGCYYVQEASSMFLQQVLRHYVPSACRMLDLCAAPGGKSTLARSVLPEGSLLVSNEIVRARAQVLAENMIKWGSPDVVVTQNAPADFAPLTQFFDVILADVPCSGEGMFRKDADSVGEWSMGNVDVCWQRQRSIVADVWECLKPGGLFIYSTCTYNTWEDEENIRWMVQRLGAEPLQVPMEEDWGIKGDVTGTDTPLPVYRFLPSHVKGEGFFLAVMRKPAGDAAEGMLAFSTSSTSSSNAGEAMVAAKRPKAARAAKGKGQQGNRLDKSIPAYDVCRSWISGTEDYVWRLSDDGILSAFPARWGAALELMQKHLTVLHAGVSVASLKGRDWVPHHSLAMSLCLCPSAFPVVEVGYDDAIAYLRHEAVVLDNALPRGFLLLSYRGIFLGFVKNVGNRANNLYPMEWRIRSGYLPGQPVTVL